MSKYRIRFQVTASPASREGMVLDYLLAGETPYPLRDMVMLSVQSFWLPLAYRDRSKAPPASELEPLIRSCVLRLQMQQQYLQSLAETVARPNGSRESPRVANCDRATGIAFRRPSRRGMGSLCLMTELHVETNNARQDQYFSPTDGC